jgi:hypothetical protein
MAMRPGCARLRRLGNRCAGYHRVRDIKVGLRLVCIRARPLAVPQVAAPEALATVNFPGATGAKAQLSEQPYGTTKAVP